MSNEFPTPNNFLLYTNDYWDLIKRQPLQKMQQFKM
jgi:hypothetical protein